MKRRGDEAVKMMMIMEVEKIKTSFQRKAQREMMLRIEGILRMEMIHALFAKSAGWNEPTHLF